MPPPTYVSERASFPDMLSATIAEAMRPNFRLRMTYLLNSLVRDGVARRGHGDELRILTCVVLPAEVEAANEREALGCGHRHAHVLGVRRVLARGPRRRVVGRGHVHVRDHLAASRVRRDAPHRRN